MFKREKKIVCRDFQVGKPTREKHAHIGYITTTDVLEFMHIDLSGPIQTKSAGGKKYAIVCVDDYSRYTWISFLRNKFNTFGNFRKIYLSVQTKKCSTLMRLRSDHDKEFEKSLFSDFCEAYGIKHEF